MADRLAVGQRRLDRAPGVDQRREVGGNDAQAEPLCGDERVQRPAPRQVDLDVARPNATPDDPRRDVAEGDPVVVDPRDDPPRGDIDEPSARPDSAAQRPRAMVPWPQAVE